LFNEGYFIKFCWEIGHIHLVKIDRQSIERVITNLILNAMEAINGTGTINIKSIENDGRVTLYITNLGSIREDIRANLFDTYYTTKETGIGLGLSIAKSLVENHGGSINCQSVNNKVTFSFDIPASNNSSQKIIDLPKNSGDLAMERNKDLARRKERENEIKAKIVNTSNLKVLVLDDDEIYRETIRSHFQSSKVLREKVVLQDASTSHSALEMAKEKKYDLVILDYDLRSLTNGLQVANKIRGLLPRAYICIHSNRDVTDFTKISVDVGADLFLPKPMSVDHILAISIAAIQKR
jgi:CheY-like chemotaxis protein